MAYDWLSGMKHFSITFLHWIVSHCKRVQFRVYCNKNEPNPDLGCETLLNPGVLPVYPGLSLVLKAIKSHAIHPQWVNRPGITKQLWTQTSPYHLCLNCFFYRRIGMSGMSLCGTPTTPRDQRKAQARASRWSFISSAWEAVVSVSRFLPHPRLTSASPALCGWSRTGKIPMSATRTEEVGGWFQDSQLQVSVTVGGRNCSGISWTKWIACICVCERERTCICYWDRDGENNACERPCERERLSRQPESRSLRAERVNLKLHLEPYKKNV